MDADMGFLANLNIYKNLIDKSIIPLTQNLIKYDELIDESMDEKLLKLTWKMDAFDHSIQLNSNNSHLDDKIFTFINEILAHNKAKKRLIPFKEDGQGTDFYLGFFTASDGKKIANLSSIELL